MNIAVFSSKSYDEEFLEQANKRHGHQLTFFEARLSLETAPLANGFDGICVFVNDKVDKAVLDILKKNGIKLVALRCSGFNNVDLSYAEEIGVTVTRVPAYSPAAVAEHTVGLLLTLSRKYHRAFARVREGNFSLEGLLGFTLEGLTVGIIGTGKIGQSVARIMKGFGCQLLGFDVYPNDDLKKMGLTYGSLDDIFKKSDIITLHCPLTPETYHLINDENLSKMKEGVIILNTGRGALIDAAAAVTGLKSGKIGHLGLDVYEEEGDLFFENLSNKVIQDDVFARLITFPNVLITGHQAFFTKEAVHVIADTTLSNVTAFEKKTGTIHVVTAEKKA